MFFRTLSTRLPRRVTAYFLLFGVAAVLWLSVGAVYVARVVTDGRSESAALRWLGRGCERVTLARLRNAEADLQPLLTELRAQSGANYCAVVSPTAIYSGHTDRNLVGQPAAERGGAVDRWGETTRVQYLGDDEVPVHEYRAPLTAGSKHVGTLRLAFSQPTLWNYLHLGAHYAPVALFGPACCMIVGAVLLNRMVRPVADIEQQLFLAAMSPSIESCELREVPSTGAAARGWNRMVQQRTHDSRGESLQQRIQQSLTTNRESRLDSVLNSVPDGVATTDEHGRLTYTNLPMSVLLGLKDAIGATSDGATNETTPIMTDELVKRWHLPETDGMFLEENRDRPVVCELTREENGERRIARVARHPVRNGGKHETHVWTMRDVTQQKLAEEMRDQFVDTATHELRTPLANIKAYAETLALADVIDIEQQKQFLNTINSEASRLARFVDDLLSVSSMEVGSLSLNKQVVDLSRLLNDVLAKVRPQLEEKKQNFEVVFPEKLPEPELDKDKIAAVLVNLLGNAVKYTPEGGRVTFRVNITDGQIELSVEDSGYGISAEELPKVFEKFYRSTDHRVQQETGTGLGLALAQEVVRLHGGKITVESELDKGSTFCVLLPRT